MATVDPHSYADPDQGRVHKLALILDVDFDAKRLAGTATLSLDGAKGGVLDLDTRDLDISKVTLGDGTELRFEIGDADAVLGQRLRISVPDATDEMLLERRHVLGGAAVLGGAGAPDLDGAEECV